MLLIECPADQEEPRKYILSTLPEDTPIEDRGWRGPPLLVDQGTKDPFLDSQLKPELLRAACIARNVPLELRMQDGYDHSYYFISTFMAEHIAWHAGRLQA